MGESELRGNIAQGDGVYKSTDGGKTWTHIGLDRHAEHREDPRPPDQPRPRVRGGVRPSGRAERRSAASSARRTAARPGRRCCTATTRRAASRSSFDPNNPQVLYASLWEAFRISHMMSSGGPGSGLFKSTDGGDHWTEISRNPGLPKGVLGKIGMAVSRADSNRVYAQIEAEDGGTFVSDDAGATWKKVSENRDVRQRAFYYTRVFADPKDKGHRLRAERRVHEVDRRRQDVDAAAPAARRQPRHVDRPDEPEALHRVERRRRDGHDQRRRDLDRPGPPDRAVLPRHHDERRAVPRVRRAAGQQHGVRLQPGRGFGGGGGGPGGAATASGLLLGRRRRERLHRATTRRTPTSSTPAATAA